MPTAGTTVFSHPEPDPVPTRIWPVFLPFAGCPYRCIFCAQDKQTGKDAAQLQATLQTLEEDLDAALSEGRGPYELAFYGGTFTALPEPWPQTFLGLAQRYRERGLVIRVRCSTRPDCVEEDTLSSLGALGLDMIELGIQSFDDTVLTQSGRGYSGKTAHQACERVKSAGFALGVQLLPGLPGDRPGVFQEDARLAADHEPEIARLYPCLVIDGTPLATAWKRGEYQPWELDRAKEELAAALLSFWQKDVRVIRLGLPPEGTLAEHILAGPWHPALGQSARGLALLDIIRERVAAMDDKPTLLEVPRRYQGELMGQAQELMQAYARIGFTKDTIRYTDASAFTLFTE